MQEMWVAELKNILGRHIKQSVSLKIHQQKLSKLKGKMKKIKKVIKYNVKNCGIIIKDIIYIKYYIYMYIYGERNRQNS